MHNMKKQLKENKGIRVCGSFSSYQWNSTFFDFSFIIKGTSETVLQFIMPLRSIYNQNIGFIEQIWYF